MWFVGKKEKKVAPIVQTVAPRCVAFIQRTLQSPTAFRLLLGSFQSCSQQISRISCVEVRVWYNCNPSTSITQPMGGWESRDEKKGRSDKGQTSLPENRIGTASNSGLCEADTPPQGETGNNTGSRRDQTSLVAWRILRFIVVLSCFGVFFFGFPARSNEAIFRLWRVGSRTVARLAHKVSATSQHQLALALSAAPSSLSWH